MKKVFKTNFEKQREQSYGELVFMSFGKIAFYMEKHPTKEPRSSPCTLLLTKPLCKQSD